MSAVLEDIRPIDERRREHLPASSAGGFGLPNEWVDATVSWYSTTGARWGDKLELVIVGSAKEFVVRRPSCEPSLRAWEFGRAESSPQVEMEVSTADDVQWLRNNLKISVAEVAALFKVSRKAVYDWLQGSNARGPLLSRVRIVRDLFERKLRPESRGCVKLFWEAPVDAGGSLLSTIRDADMDQLVTRAEGALDQLRPRLNEFAARVKSKPSFDGNGRAHNDDIYPSI